jgi:Zn-dependent protease
MQDLGGWPIARLESSLWDKIEREAPIICHIKHTKMSALLFIALSLLSLVTLWALLVVILTIHEYGHLHMMSKLGIRADKVVVGSWPILKFKVRGLPVEVGALPLWGFVKSQGYESANSSRRAAIAAAGPLMSLVTGILFWMINDVHPIWLVGLLAKGSFVLFATNVIPLPPLDGWTVLEHFLQRHGFKVGTRTKTYLLGLGLASALIACYFV